MSTRILLVLVLVVLLGCSARQTAPTSTPAAVEPEALQVLHAWDGARALAWQHQDPVELAALYVPGSPAGVQDVTLLRRYRARGVRLVGIRMQVLSVRIVVDRDTALRLEVVERFAGAQAESAGGIRYLPTGRPVRRTIDLRKAAGRWLVAAISSSPREALR